ncbi:MAG: response regulator [Cyclobacteriaceae bacterium]
MRRKYLIILWVLMFCSRLSIGDGNSDIQFIQIKERLTQNTGTSLLQDRDGFLWIGTRNGLNRYDGVNMVSYVPENSPGSISGGDILALFEDSSGTIWIGTYQDGLNRYDQSTDSFIAYRHDSDDIHSISDNKINCIYEDQEGYIWVGTERGGLNRLNKERTQFAHFKKNADDPFSISSNVISVITADTDNNLWVGTEGGGMNLFNQTNNRFIHYTHDPQDPGTVNSNIIRSIYNNGSGNIWIGSDEGLNRLYYDHNGRYVFENIPFDNRLNNKVHNVVLSIMEDSNEKLWIGTENGGIITFDKDQKQLAKYFHQSTEEYSILSNSIWSLLEDQRGFVWVGTYNQGIFKVDPNYWKFKHIKNNPFNKNSLVYNYVSCFAEDEKGNIWVGTDGGGLDYWNQQDDSFQHYNVQTNSGLRADHAQSLVVDAKGTVWAGFWQGGVSILKQGKKQFEKLAGIDHPVLETGNIVSILEDSHSRIWLGAFRYGLLMYDPSTLQMQEFRHDEKDPTSLSSNLVTSIYEDSKGNIWVGTEGQGLNRRSGMDGSSGFRRYSKHLDDSTSLSNNLVHCIFEDSKKNIWVGTSVKLNLYSDDTDDFLSFGAKEGLADEAIYGVLEDGAGDLWISTNNGIVRFSTDSDSFRSYGLLDGLQGYEFFKQSCLKRKDGQMLFGGKNGFNVFDPKKITDNTYQPPVYFTDFRISNKSIKPAANGLLTKDINRTERVDLKYFQNDFSFDFSVLSFSQSSKNIYAYQLVNYDDDWQYIGNRSSAFYTNVPAGNYTFRVKATNNDRIWSDNIASIKMYISPAWYATYWAFGIYALLVLAAIWWGLSTIINRERLQAQYRVEHMELSKMQELDEMKSRFFANISHEFRTPLTLILGPLKGLRDMTDPVVMKDQIGLMIRNAESLLNLINQLLELSKLESGKLKLEAAEQDVVGFLKPLIKSFSPMANKNYINYRIDLPTEEVELYFDDEKLEKIVVNLLSNAFKYTPEFGKVGFTVKKEKEHVMISVSDSGVGVPKEEAEYIFDRYYRINNKKETRNKGTGIGLSLTKELVELHQGRIGVFSEERNGAEFKIHLPLGKKHLKEEEIVEKSLMNSAPSIDVGDNQIQLGGNANKIIDGMEEQMSDLPLVLVIDDHDDIRAYVKQVLEGEYQVIDAENGLCGLEKAKESIPDLIISDIMMSGIDGYEVCKKLKLDVKTSHIPVILLTAKASNESAVEGFEIGADYYITKPFNPKLLKLRVRNILKTRDQIRDQLLNKETLNIEPKNVQIADKDQNFLNDAVAIVEKNMSNSEFLVDDLGKEMGLSRMQLYRKLKGLIGQSANEFTRSIRLKRAAQLLNQGVMNISEITYEVGFNDLQYFRDCFKKQYGVNPSEYANSSDKVS